MPKLPCREAELVPVVDHDRRRREGLAVGGANRLPQPNDPQLVLPRGEHHQLLLASDPVRNIDLARALARFGGFGGSGGAEVRGRCGAFLALFFFLKKIAHSL